jgi:hypothetical protein
MNLGDIFGVSERGYQHILVALCIGSQHDLNLIEKEIHSENNPNIISSVVLSLSFKNTKDFGSIRPSYYCRKLK